MCATTTPTDQPKQYRTSLPMSCALVIGPVAGVTMVWMPTPQKPTGGPTYELTTGARIPMDVDRKATVEEQD